MNKAFGVAESEKSLEAEIGRNTHELKRTAAVLQPAGAEHEMTGDNLGIIPPDG